MRIFKGNSLFFSAIFFTWATLAAGLNPAPQNPVLAEYFVKGLPKISMDQIATEFEVESAKNGGYEVLVPVPRAAEFHRYAPNAILLDPDITQTLKNRIAMDDERAWRTFDSVQLELDQIVAQYPELTSVEKYGESMEGRPLRALRVMSQVPSKQAKPQLVITSATHGNELITVEVNMGLLHLLLQGYGKDKRLTQMVDTHEIYFIPVISPDGYIRKERYCNGIDPNRNYPWPEKPDRDPNPAIKSIMNFFATHDIKGAIDYHSKAGMIMYPWAYTYDNIPAEMKGPMEALTRQMASFNGYSHGQIAQTIYIAPGSSADYYYWKFNTKALGIEIRLDGSSSLIPAMLEENRESTWAFIESF